MHAKAQDLQQKIGGKTASIGNIALEGQTAIEKKTRHGAGKKAGNTGGQVMPMQPMHHQEKDAIIDQRVKKTNAAKGKKNTRRHQKCPHADALPRLFFVRA